MKVTVINKESEPDSIVFPVIMRYKGDGGAIVLFISETTGIRLSAELHLPLSFKPTDGWISAFSRNHWEKFEGDILISNNKGL
jgi:hypothetical protein